MEISLLCVVVDMQVYDRAVVSKSKYYKVFLKKYIIR
jgi:hypothetical protein